LDTVELVWGVEGRFGIEITDADAATCRTVGQLNQCVARLVAERASIAQRQPIAPEPDLTWPLLVAIVVEVAGVPAERVRPDAEWGRDLGMD
jgi:acyl carrier protein